MLVAGQPLYGARLAVRTWSFAVVCVHPALSSRLHRAATAGATSVRLILRGTRALSMVALGTVSIAGHAWTWLLQTGCGVGLVGIKVVVSASNVA